MPIHHSVLALSCAAASALSLVACTTNYNTYESSAAGSRNEATAGEGSTLHGSAGGAGGTPSNSLGGEGGADTNGSAGTLGDAGSAGTISGPSAAYEAETAFNAGSATFASASKGFSGSGYIEALASKGAKVVFAVNAASAANASASLQYSANSARKVALYLNGAKREDALLEAAPAFAAHASTLPLRAGLNTVAYVNEDGASGTVSIDKLDITNGAALPVRGAIQPFTEYEAEAGMGTGAVVGPDRTYGTMAAEASGRKAMHLDGTGKFVEWVTSAKANALSIRYSMPDAAEGGGTTGNISLYIDGKKQQPLPVSSKYAWVYGGYPYQGKPSDGSPHRFFDESRYLVSDIAVGAKLRLQRDDGDADITIDLIDTEVVPAAYPQPSGALSLTDFGGKADDGVDDAAALRSAVKAAQAQKKVLYLPLGTFDIKSQIEVAQVTIRGAGPWYTVLQGAAPSTGFRGAGSGVQLLDFAIFGGVTVREDGDLDSGLDGSYGSDLLVQNLWIEHTKTGVWLSGPTKGGYVIGCRIHGTLADGVNLYAGTSFTAIEHTHVRNTGDDGLAMYSKDAVNEGNRFKFDTVRLPMLANGAAIYGGSGNSIEDLDIADTVVAAAGVAVSTRFDGTTLFAGTTRVERTTVTRTGGHEPNWNSNFGGLWIFADPNKGDLSAPIIIRDVSIDDSTYQGLFISDQKSVTNLTFDKVAIRGTGSFGIEINTPGSGRFDGVTVENAKTATHIATAFTVMKGAGNSGW